MFTLLDEGRKKEVASFGGYFRDLMGRGKFIPFLSNLFRPKRYMYICSHQTGSPYPNDKALKNTSILILKYCYFENEILIF